MCEDGIECLLGRVIDLNHSGLVRLSRFPIIFIVPPLSSTSIELNSYYFPFVQHLRSWLAMTTDEQLVIQIDPNFSFIGNNQ